MPANNMDDFAPTAWGKTNEILEVPSGQKCLVKRPDIAKLAVGGLLDKMDVFTSLVDQKHVSKKAAGGKNSKKSSDMQSSMAMARLAKNPEQLAEVIRAMDQVVMSCVVAPEIHSVIDDAGVEIPDSERDDELIYVDSVDLNDRIFIMNWAFGGSKDLARFRRELQQSVDDLENVTDVSETA